jgi:ribosomal protein L19
VNKGKKQRSDIVQIQIKDILHYSFIGICIAHKKDPYGLNTSFTIRNVFDRVPVETIVILYSPVIDDVSIYSDIKKLKRIIHNKYYFLRKKPMPQSVITFDYVTDITADFINKKDDIYSDAIVE